MDPAVRAARGSSIIVPMRMVNSLPDSSATSAMTAANSRRVISNSVTVATSGTMISGRTTCPRLRASTAASATARVCSANRPGTTKPSRTPRSPIIGLTSCSRSSAASSFRSRSSGARPAALVADIRVATSAGSERNSCKGGSSRRIVTGRPSIASKTPMKSARCRGSSAASAAVRSGTVSARTSRSTNPRRSPRNMCSVRHRPMPCAPYRRARAASSGVSALASTPSLRRSSAC